MESAFNELQLQLSKQNDITAFGKLIKQYEQLIFSITYRMLNDNEAAKALALDIIAKAHANINNFDNIPCFENWLIRTTAANCILLKNSNKHETAVFSTAKQVL